MQDQIETFGMLLIKGVIAPAFTALLAWATVQLSGWIKAKSHNEKVTGVLDRLRELAFHVVQEVQQTIVSALPDKADKSALLAARDTALSTLKSHLGEKGLRELMTVFGLKDNDAVVDMLLSYIESAVMTMKASNGPMTTTVVKTMAGPLPFDEKTTTVVQPGNPPVIVMPAITQGIAP
jgi:hypothetical protein